VQSGVGRSGKWWAHSLFDDDVAKPDLMVFAKVGGGVQLRVGVKSP
jgi:4-aminobutyrate aminotransferase-like enzyme